MDDSTTTTFETLGTESQVAGGVPLAMTVAPRYDTIGVGAAPPSPARSTGLMEGAQKVMNTTEFCVSLKAGELPESEEARAPVDIVVALDKSGSMDDRGKIDLCKETLYLLLRHLLPRDRFGLVVYDDEARLALPLQRMTSEHKSAASRAIAALRADGGTNMASAVVLSAQEMRAVSEPNPVQTVFFLTDGHANSGICDEKGLVALVRNCFTGGDNVDAPPSAVQANTSLFQRMNFLGRRRIQQQQKQQRQKHQKQVQITAQVLQSYGVAGQVAQQAAVVKESARKPPSPPKTISLHTFGYGADHKGALLREMASAYSGGSYYYIEEDKGVGTAFGDALGGVLSVVAQNATVTLDIPVAAKAMGVEIEKIHHDQTIRNANGSYTVSMGDFYAEETRELIVTVKLATPPVDSNNPIPHITAGLSYVDTVESGVTQGDTIVSSVARPENRLLSEENPHVAAQCFRVYAVKEMEEAEKMASAGRYEEAQTLFRSMKTTFATCSPAVQAMPQARVLWSDADEMDKQMDDTTFYGAGGQAILNSKMCAHKAQRSAVSSNSPNGYVVYGQCKKRADYSSKFTTH